MLFDTQESNSSFGNIYQPSPAQRVWVGHSTEGITDRYTVESLKRDVAYRKATAEQAGLGFHMPLASRLPVAPHYVGNIGEVAPIARKMYSPKLAATA
jgi:hypothetical protein